MARLCFAFKSPSGRHGLEGLVSRDEILRWRDEMPEAVANLPAHPDTLIRDILTFGPSLIKEMTAAGHEGICRMIASWAIWHPGTPDLQARAGVEDLTINFSLVDGDVIVTVRDGVEPFDLPKLAKGSYDYGGEIATAIGALERGARIVLNALPSLVNIDETSPLRQIMIRIDDNDAPGIVTRLNFFTSQPPEAYRYLIDRGGIVEVTVIDMYADGTVIGTVRLLSAADETGKITGKLPDAIRYTPDHGAMLCPVFNAAGEPVWFHALFLERGGRSKMPGREKKRLLAELWNGAPKPVKLPVRGEMKTAILANRVMQTLANPRKYPLAVPIPLNTIDEILERKGIGLWREEGFHKTLADYSKPVVGELIRAHKFVLEPDFLDIVNAWALQRPTAVEQLLATARLPYDPMWIEDRRGNGCLIKSYKHRRLITDGTTKPLPDFRASADDPWYEIIPFSVGSGDTTRPRSWPRVTPDDNGLIGSHPHAVIFSHNGTKIQRAAEAYTLWEQQELPLDVIALGSDYYSKYRRRYRSILEDLASHVHWIGSTPGAIRGQYYFTLARQRGCADDPALRAAAVAYLEATTCYIGEVFRLTVSALALLSTHIGGGPLLNYRPERAPSLFVKGKFLPAYEFKTVTLVRPMTAPRLLRRAFPARKSQLEGMRWHEVSGAWHHRRAATSICAQHPRACPQAMWSPLYDDDGKKLGADQQACELCRRKRWRVEQHPRGDKNLGIVEKGFEVHGSRHARFPQQESRNG